MGQKIGHHLWMAPKQDGQTIGKQIYSATIRDPVSKNVSNFS